MQRSLDLGQGLQLTLESDGQWCVVGANGSWPIDDQEDYYRAVTLLEKDYFEARDAIDRLAREVPTARPFQLEAVVLVGLRGGSEYWALLAMKWVEQLPEEQLGSLEEALRVVSAAKWASQKLRHAAMRHLKRSN